jgi:hypothetical protein
VQAAVPRFESVDKLAHDSGARKPREGAPGTVDWPRLLEALVAAERRVLDGERNIRRQEEILIRLALGGHDLHLALELLIKSRAVQQSFISERDRLRAELDRNTPTA